MKSFVGAMTATAAAKPRFVRPPLKEWERPPSYISRCQRLGIATSFEKPVVRDLFSRNQPSEQYYQGMSGDDG
jgi:hypothetical protein